MAIKFKCGESTIRRDLDRLRDLGLLVGSPVRGSHNSEFAIRLGPSLIRPHRSPETPGVSDEKQAVSDDVNDEREDAEPASAAEFDDSPAEAVSDEPSDKSPLCISLNEGSEERDLGKGTTRARNVDVDRLIEKLGIDIDADTDQRHRHREERGEAPW